MALTSEQKRTLEDARAYEVIATWFCGIVAMIGAIAGGLSVGFDSRGGVVFAIICLLIAVWIDRRRREYKADIKYLQEQSPLP